MNLINDSKLLEKFREITDVIYKNWWAERNGGNISVILKDEEVASFKSQFKKTKSKKLTIQFKELSGKYLLVTGSGRYYRNISKKSETPKDSGIIQINNNGDGYDVVWGFEDNESWPTSELPSHLMSHKTRLSVDEIHSVVIHSHPTDIIALTFVEELDEKEFTIKMWKMISEASVVFPEGIGIVPWMLPGSDEVAIETAKKMKNYRAVIWAHHGVFCSGTNLDETLGLLECLEKSAKIYLKILSTNTPIKNEISKQNIKDMCEFFGSYKLNKNIID